MKWDFDKYFVLLVSLVWFLLKNKKTTYAQFPISEPVFREHIDISYVPVVLITIAQAPFSFLDFADTGFSNREAFRHLCVARLCSNYRVFKTTAFEAK